MKIAVVLGSSKSDGNTRHLVDKYMLVVSNVKLFDLSNYNISFFDYNHTNKNDDFLALITELTNYEQIVFASPVYWYSMSAQLKVFFDRLSDLLIIEKALGRKLKGKSIAVLSTGFDEKLPECFVQPFELTAIYLQMNFKGSAYLSVKSQIDLDNALNVVEQAVRSF
jgi:multimeric flavodoxin WrbA